MHPGQVLEAHAASVMVVVLKVELVHAPLVPLGAPVQSSLHGVPSGTCPVGFTLVTFWQTLPPVVLQV